MITDFLKTKRSIDELKVALDVLHDFKKCESSKEYLGTWFSAWAKLEQLQEFLEHLVNGEQLQADTIAYIQQGDN